MVCANQHAYTMSSRDTTHLYLLYLVVLWPQAGTSLKVVVQLCVSISTPSQNGFSALLLWQIDFMPFLNTDKVVVVPVV